MDNSKNDELSEIKKKDESIISLKSNNGEKETYQDFKEKNNLNERIIKLFIGNHPLLSLKTIKNLSRLHFLNKYSKDDSFYNSIIIEHIIHNEPGHIVAEFKDFLILGDINEFLQNYYKLKESKYILPKIFEYYINCSVIFPNYVILPESQYIYKNIQKKQKVIDIQQEQEDKEEKIKKGEVKPGKEEEIFTTQILDSILNQTDTSGIKQYFGVSTDGNSLGDQLSKIIEGIHYYENNKVSDLKPKFNNYLYKNHEKINLNDSFFKNKNENLVINGNKKNSELYSNNQLFNNKDKNEGKLINNNQFGTEVDNKKNKINKKQVLILNKNSINKIIDLSNSIKIINEISLNNISNKNNENNANNGVSLKYLISKNLNNSRNKNEIKDIKKKGRNCFGNLIQVNNNFYTASNDNGGNNNILNSVSNSKCNTSRHVNQKKKIINNPKKINHKKIIHKNRNVCSSDINIFHSKVIKKSLINSLLNSERALEISNKDFKNTNDRGTLTNNKENTKTSLNSNYYVNSTSKNRSKKNKIAIRNNINVSKNFNVSENIYFRNKNSLFFSDSTKNDKNIVYQRKKNTDISSYYNKNKSSNSIRDIKIGFNNKNFSSNNILEYKINPSTSNYSPKNKNKNKENNNIKDMKKENIPNNQKKISRHFNIKSNDFLTTNKKLNLNDDLSNGNNNVIRTENEGDKIFFKKEKTNKNNKDIIKITSYKYKVSKNSTFKMNNSNSKLNTARFINLEGKFEKKSSEKNIRNSYRINSPRNSQTKRLLLKSDLREKIMNEDHRRPLTMRESFNKKVINTKVIEVLTNKINKIKEFMRESDKKNQNSISHIFRKKKVGRKKILKDNDEIIAMKYGLTERERNNNTGGKLNLKKENSGQKKKKISIDENIKNNKIIIKNDKKQIKNSDKKKKTSNSKNKKVNKKFDINKVKYIRNKNNINNGNNYLSDISYNINLNNCHIHTKNKSEFYQNINNININNDDNISINNNTEFGKENKSIILINNNVKIGSLKVFPMKQMDQKKIIVKGIKINGFEKLVSKKYTTRNIEIPKAVTDRMKKINGGTSQINSNRYINTSNNNGKKLGKKKNVINFYKNI